MPISHSEEGFTLIEILVILVILGLSANIILTRFHPTPTSTTFPDEVSRMMLARAHAQSQLSTNSFAAPWIDGDVAFSPDGFIAARSFVAHDQKLELLPWGGFRLVP